MHVQMQIVRRCAGGEDLVVYAEDLDVPNHREYLDHETRFARECTEDEHVRTVGEGSRFAVAIHQEIEESP